MRVLLDECVSEEFGPHLDGHDVVHIERLGQKRVLNGALLNLAREGYDALITIDKGILHQHDHRGHMLRVLVLRVPSSTLESLLTKRAETLAWLAKSQPGDTGEV